MSRVCERIQSELSPFLDGELSQERSSQVADHLAGCVECKGQGEVLQSARKALRTIADAPAVPDQWAQIRSRLETKSRWSFAAPSRVWRWSPAAASILVVAIAATLFWPISSDRDTSIEPYLGLYMLAASASDVLSSQVSADEIHGAGLKFPAYAPGQAGSWVRKRVFLHKLHGEPVVQVFYAGEGGNHYCIFQQSSEHPLDFGARETQQDFVRNQICTKFSNDDFRFISWSSGGTRFTVISTDPQMDLNSIAADWIETAEGE